MAKFTITQIRDSVVDYTVPFWHESAVMVMRMPEENSLLVYLGPIHNELWLSIILAVPFMAFSLASVAVMRAAVYGGVAVLKKLSFLAYFNASVWFSYGALVQQGDIYITSSLNYCVFH